MKPIDKIDDGVLGEMVVMSSEAARAGFKSVQIDPEHLLTLLLEVVEHRRASGKATP